KAERVKGIDDPKLAIDGMRRGFQEAGTQLTVTPTISEAGFLRLQYDVELSSFDASPTTDGVPPPRNTQSVTGQATIPSDATIVVGGITTQLTQNTVAKVPLLGDIPLLGLFFQERSETTSDSKLYVFITPRIMSDPNFNDLRSITVGPQAAVDIDADLPLMTPEPIEFIVPRTRGSLDGFDPRPPATGFEAGNAALAPNG
ncbi:MAG: hypothetical protein AAF235_12035, partial [Planctomycetota bacterium]